MTKLVIALLVLSSVARADDDDGVAELGKKLTAIAPGPGRETAPARRPAWCSGRHQPEQGWAYTVESDLDTYRDSPSYRSSLFHAAQLLCGAPNNRTVERAAAVIEQLWINDTGMSDFDAVASLTARIAPDWTSEHDKVCAKIGEPRGNTDKDALARVSRNLLGCYTDDPLWMRPTNDFDHLAELVDRGVVSRDPVAHLAWVLQRQFTLLDPTEAPERNLIGYVVDQFDLGDVAPDKVLEAIDATYGKSRYTHVLAVESLARAKMRTALVEEAVAKLTSDPMWKELLVTAPKRGAAAWNEAADKHKDALARSDAYADGKTSDCAPLYADALAAIKRVKHDDFDTLDDNLSDDPLAGLLLHRLAHCMRDSKDKGWVAVGMLSGEVRVKTGPRMAAYYESIDALAKIPERKRPSFRSDVSMLDDSLEREHHSSDRGWGGYSQGPIAKIEKANGAVKVTFVEKKVQVHDYDCHEGNKVDRILPDGRVQYRQVCTDKGLVWRNESPPPASVSPTIADGLKAGRFAVIDPQGETGADLPIAVFDDANEKHLLAYYGFAL